ncbi:hypothetical protein CYMTET_47469 [Cymbomonas tetramitiformis]|uniref:Uncharacterized protein n=1 Tax=Cymbomonas tetramitiformis TaxID=36881 RepID=A0AAE0BU48_9CHLO|nr:hypothetical protein CYMTET_47469 [Cymbomonas tetramitiformis]
MEQSTLAELCECGQLNKKGKLIECKQDPLTMDHEGKRCTRVKRGKGELRCAKCSGQSKKPARGKEKYLDDFDRTRAIGFANNFVVSLPEDTRQHLERRSSLMWREALNKVPDWDKLPSGMPLNQPLTEPAQHLAIVAYLGPCSPTRVCSAPTPSLEASIDLLGQSTQENLRLNCDIAFREQRALMLPKETLDAFAVNVGGKEKVELGECAVVGGVHQGVSNADGTPRIVFSANLALKDVASYDPDVQLNPVNSPIHWGFLDFAAKEYVKYFLAGTDLAPTVDDANVKVLNTLGADVMKCLDKVTNKRRREAEGARKRGRR